MVTTVESALIVAALVAFGIFGKGRWFSAPQASPPIRSLAVLPMENLSGDPKQEYFADGVTEALITDLAQIGELRVISRTSVMAYKGARKPLPKIARELHVDAVVEGSVERSNEKVQINVQLIQAATDRHLWAKSYEQDLRDILSLQNSVAREVADEVRIKLTPQEQARLSSTRPVNPEAHEAYLAGRFYWNKRTADGVLKSIDYLNQAIAKDPQYALAYAALAESYRQLPDLNAVPASEAFSKARSAALKAIELDESLSQAHTALANIKEDYDWDWSGAENEYRRAIQLDPGYEVAHAGYAQFLMDVGRFPEALVEAKTAEQLDPLSPFMSDNLAVVLYYSGQYDAAVEQCRKTLEIESAFRHAHRHLALVYIERHQYPEAVSELRNALESSPGSTEALAELGYAFGVWGKNREAQTVLSDLRDPHLGNYISPYHLAMVYIGLGDKERALQALTKAVDDRSPGVVHIKTSPLFRELRSEPQFRALLDGIGLGDTKGTS
jgi:TolB-like protein/Tfp pilus assembly protein PilF